MKKAEKRAKELYPTVPLDIPETTSSGEILNSDETLDNFRLCIQSFSLQSGYVKGYEEAEAETLDRVKKILNKHNTKIAHLIYKNCKIKPSDLFVDMNALIKEFDENE